MVKVCVVVLTLPRGLLFVLFQPDLFFAYLAVLFAHLKSLIRWLVMWAINGREAYYVVA